MNKCKACSSPYLDAINQLLIDGISFDQVSRWLKQTHQYSITASALHRHATKHIEGFKSRNTLENRSKIVSVDVYEQGIPVAEGMDPVITVNLKQLQKKLGCLDSPLPEVAKVFLQKIICNQLALVLEKQESHMQGIGLFPESEIRSLSLLLGVCDRITGMKRSGRVGSNIMDLEVALSVTKEEVENPDFNQVLELFR